MQCDVYDQWHIVAASIASKTRYEIEHGDGEFIDMWTDFKWPQDLYVDKKNDIVYVVEATVAPPPQPRVSIRDLKGNILSSWEGRESEGKGVLEISHSICVDSRGDIYIGEIVRNKRLLKFAKVS